MTVEVNDKIKVLIAGYTAEGHTSFGCQIREVWTRLHKTGKYDIVQHGWMPHSGNVAKVPWRNIHTNNTWNEQGAPTFMPEDKWGQKSFVRVMKEIKPQLVWTLADLYMVEHLGAFKRQMGYKYIQYCPIDGVPPPPKYEKILNQADLNIAVCKFGAEAMESLVGYDVPYIFHGVDTDLFVPYTNQRRQEIRSVATQSIVENDAFVIGWLGKDQTRKQPWNLFEITYYLRSGHYVTCNSCERVTRGSFDKSRKLPTALPTQCRYCYSKDMNKGTPINAYFWCHAYNQPQQGWDFSRLMDQWHLKEHVIFTTALSQSQGLTPQEIVDLFNCFDVCVSFSGGEGFGIPLIEAQACGIPVAYTDYSGQIEICQKGGLPVKVSALVPESITHIDRAITCIDDAIRVLRDLHDHPEMRRELGAKGRADMIDNFNHDELCNQHHELILKTLQETISLVGVTV